MIRAFDNSGPIGHMNSCGQSGIGGLHVTAGLKDPPIDFSSDSELIKRHSATNWAKGKQGWELPLCLQLTRHLNPIPYNVDLFNYMLQRGETMRTLAWSQVDKHDNAFRRRTEPKQGQTYLFDGHSVDPSGPIADMIRAFDNSGPIGHMNSCGQSGIGGTYLIH